MRKFFSLFAAMLLCLPMMQGAIKVHTIGDSTMAEYDESTTDETRVRNRFSAIAAAVNARAKDLMKISTDQAAFIAQKDLPNGKKTMRSYLWKLEKEAYDAEHQG